VSVTVYVLNMLYIILQHCECYSVRFEYVIYYTSAL